MLLSLKLDLFIITLVLISQISAKTKEGQVEDSQIDLQFVVRELSDGRVFKFKDTDTIDTTEWFASVPV